MTTNIQLAGRVARYVQLRTVALRSANVMTDFDPEQLPAEIAVDLKYRAGLDFRPGDRDREPDSLGVLVEFQFTLRTGGEQQISDVLGLTASYLLVYSLARDAELDERCLRYFAEVNGPYNAWPYLRELVQSVTGRVGLGGLTIPVFHPNAADVPEDDLKDFAESESS